MLLHEIYGKDLFKITNYDIDILRYRPKSVLLTEMAGGPANMIEDDEGVTGYIEDGTYTNKRPNSNTKNRQNSDFRVDIPAQDDSNDNDNGIITSGIKWLFGR
jgi:hypothetical protein